MQNKRIFLWLEAGWEKDGAELTVKAAEDIGSGRNSAGERVPDGKNEDGEMRIAVTLTGPDGYLLDESGVLSENGEAHFRCPGVRPWDPEHPVLYQVNAKLLEEGRTAAEAGQRIGFRSLKREGKLLLWNGRPLKLKGVCYREAPGAPIRRDLELFRGANVNFLRSIYGPFSGEFLDLCDEMGFLTEDTAPFCEIGQSGPAKQDAPHCREEFTEAAERMLMGGSHVSVLIWSLGHDCTWGANFRAMAEMIRGVDAVRPITFHLPMSVPEEDWQPDVWPVHYIDYRQPFDVCYDQMVIFHTPGAENEIGYMTGEAPYDLPVLHELWSPVACHNRAEIQKDPSIREFWGESIRRFAEKSLATDGCLGGAVLAGVDEDGSFENMGKFAWGILDQTHSPKPEYWHLQAAYMPVKFECAVSGNGKLRIRIHNQFLFSDLSEYDLVIDGEKSDTELSGAPGTVTEYDVTVGISDTAHEGKEALASGAGILLRAKDGSREYRMAQERKPDSSMREWKPGTSMREHKPGIRMSREKCGGAFAVEEREKELVIKNSSLSYVFSRESCLMTGAFVSGKEILAGGPYLNCTGLTLGEWRGRPLETKKDGEAVLLWIRGTYENVMELSFFLTIWPDGSLDTAYEVETLYRHMPHTVKAEIGVATGGLNEKGVSYLLSPGVTVTGRGPFVRVEKAPWYTPGAVVDDRDERMRYTGVWVPMDDFCGDYGGTETLSARAGDEMSLAFTGTGVRLYGPADINYGMCDIYLDGTRIAEKVSQYPDKVDFPGMSRGYEKQYNWLLAEAHGLEEGPHELLVRVTGEKEPGAQNAYTAIDYAVLEGAAYPEGSLLHVNQDFNFSRMVRGCYRRPKVELIPGVRESCRIRLLCAEVQVEQEGRTADEREEERV